MRPLRLLVLVLAAAAVSATPAAAAELPKAPAGLKFYDPPAAALKGSAHGGPIWSRRQTGPDKLKDAASNHLVLYRSIGVDGKAVAVSGSVAIPKGRAPKDGWPVITYAHGTSGIADQCAPTRSPRSGGVSGFHNYVYPLLRRWLKAGYAVVRTDYEGLGTPGEHPYLVGRSAGRSTLDIVRAARKLDLDLDNRVVIAGHSQGGHAALWATSLAPSWTPELDIEGTVAFAPASHLSEQMSLVRSITTPSPALSAFAGILLRGIDVAGPVDVDPLLSARAAPVFPQTATLCLEGLAAPESFGGIPPAELLRSDADLGPLIAAIDRFDDPENLKLRTPVLIEQGEADSTVFPLFTDQLNQKLGAKGAKVIYKKYPGVNHGDIVDKAAKHATAFIAKQLR
jgi:pimeloyl-ACP methyl ester carboxylesterase